MDGLERAITRPELEEVLSAQTGDEKQLSRLQMFVEMMHDPAHSNKKLATMGRECGLTYTELTDMIKKHRLAEGIVRMTEHVPQVMEDVAKESLSSTGVCEKCDGAGSVLKDQEVKMDGEKFEVKKVPVPCKHCKGTGEVVKPGSAAARKILFETVGLTGKAPLVNVNNNTLNVDGGGMEDVLRMGRGRQLPEKGTPPTITAEEVKPSEEA